MNDRAKDICERKSRAASDRARFEPMFNDALRLTMPGRRRFNDSGSVQAGEDIFDETGANAVAEFVSRIQAGITPAFTSFLKLEAGEDVDERDRAAVNRDLDDITKFMFAEIWASNFHQEFSELLYDVSLSTGTMLVEEGTGSQSLVHRALPLTETLLERGPDNGVGGVFRVSTRKAKHLQALYPKAVLGMRLEGVVRQTPERDLEVIDFCEHLPRRRTGEERTRHSVVVNEFHELLWDKTYEGDGSNPFQTVRWQTTAGEVWGRGPLMNALGAIRTTNLMVQLVLENAAMAIVGIYQTDNDATIMSDNLQLVPGMILSKEVGSNGLEQVRTSGSGFSMQDVVVSDQRLNIKRALFNDMLSDPNKTPATATEVVERMADLAHRTSAGFGRMYYEFLVPYIRRVLFILQKRGDITLPVKGGRTLAYRAVSPIAQAQEMRGMQTLVQDYQIRQLVLGQQGASASYDMEQLLPWLEDRTGLPRSLYKKPKDIMAAIKEQSDAMMAMQMQMGQAGMAK